MATSLYDHKNVDPPPTLAPLLAPLAAAAPVEVDRKAADLAGIIADAPAISNETHQALLSAYPVLGPTVAMLIAKGKGRNEAWLIGGALLGYTGNVAIPGPIRKATGTQQARGEPDLFPKPATVNNALRGTIPATEGLRVMIRLLESIELMPDIDDSGIDPTRMMDYYPAIDTHYAVGNVLIMAEVGSVGRSKPASGSELYKRKYRLHFKGGLKDVTLLNPAQQEVIYAPGAMYYVESRRIGKVKEKKGNQAHVHIHLKHVTRASPEYVKASSDSKVIDLRAAAYQH